VLLVAPPPHLLTGPRAARRTYQPRSRQRCSCTDCRWANCCGNYEVIAPGVADGKRIHIPVPACLIHLDDGSLALVDTGMNRRHIPDPGHTRGGTPLADQLMPDNARAGHA
jgi:hypothetical protein